MVLHWMVFMVVGGIPESSSSHPPPLSPPSNTWPVEKGQYLPRSGLGLPGRKLVAMLTALAFKWLGRGVEAGQKWVGVGLASGCVATLVLAATDPCFGRAVMPGWHFLFPGFLLASLLLVHLAITKSHHHDYHGQDVPTLHHESLLS